MIEGTDSILNEAEKLYSRGSCDDAVLLLSETLEYHPTENSVRIRLAELLLDSGRHAQALQVLTVIPAVCETPLVSLLIGHCQLALGDVDGAGEVANMLLSQNPYSPGALSLQGLISLKTSNQDHAERLLKEALTYDAGCALAWSGLASLFREQKDDEGAWNCARKAFICSPSSREIAIAFHESCLLAGTLPQTEADLRAAINLHPMNRRLRFLRIDLLLRQAKLTEALEEIQSCLVDFGVDAGILMAAMNVRDRLGPIYTPTNRNSGGSLSLCMIVKDEKDNLSRCLRSAVPLVEEIIVVDTGSSDETKDVARIFGARVYDFAWSNDFSAARNFSIAQATSKWILVLDADEVLSSKDRDTIKDVLTSVRRRPAAFRIQTRNYSNQLNTIGFRPNQDEYPEERGAGWHPSEKVRLFTNDPQIRFEYPVHELVEPSLERINVRVEDCSAVVHHYGTLEARETLKKTLYYRKLGKKKLHKKARNPAALKELAVQTAQLGNHLEALELWRRFVRLQPLSAEAYLNMGTAHYNVGQYPQAAACAEKASRLKPGLKEAYSNQALALLCMGRAEKASKVLHKLNLIEPNYAAGRFLFCTSCACEGDGIRFEEELEKLRGTEIGPFLGESFFDMAEKLIAASQPDYARRTLEAAITADYTSDKILSLLSICTSATCHLQT